MLTLQQSGLACQVSSRIPQQNGEMDGSAELFQSTLWKKCWCHPNAGKSVLNLHIFAVLHSLLCHHTARQIHFSFRGTFLSELSRDFLDSPSVQMQWKWGCQNPWSLFLVKYRAQKNKKKIAFANYLLSHAFSQTDPWPNLKLINVVFQNHSYVADSLNKWNLKTQKPKAT